ncbi:MAG: hypothetical protein ACRCU5_16870 [Rhizobiaceae bacterium]
MNEFIDRKSTKNNVTRLSDVVREVRVAAADKSDVVIDMKEADRARLELLALELKPVFDEVPQEFELFDFAISSGLQPRLWIDAISHVQMGRDRRTYRFVRDTRVGRVVLAESLDMKPVADQVTRYIAERMIERQRMMEGDVESLRYANVKKLADSNIADLDASEQSGWNGLVAGFIWVLIGAVAGGGLLLALLSKDSPGMNGLMKMFGW